MYTTVQKSESVKCFEEINAFVKQGCIKLIKSDSEDIYTKTKDFYFDLSIHQRTMFLNHQHTRMISE